MTQMIERALVIEYTIREDGALIVNVDFHEDGVAVAEYLGVLEIAKYNLLSRFVDHS